MTIKPVEHTPKPGYPDRHRLLAMPLVAGMLSAAVALGMGGCGADSTQAETTTALTETGTLLAGGVGEYLTDGEPATLPTTPETSAAEEEYVIMGDMPVPTTTRATTKSSMTSTTKKITTTSTTGKTTTEKAEPDAPTTVPVTTTFVTLGTFPIPTTEPPTDFVTMGVPPMPIPGE